MEAAAMSRVYLATCRGMGEWKQAILLTWLMCMLLVKLAVADAPVPPNLIGQETSKSFMRDVGSIRRRLSQIRLSIDGGDVIRGVQQAVDFFTDRGGGPTEENGDRFPISDFADSSEPFVAQVVGGTTTEEGRYPFMCSLRTKSGSHFCGCTLVAANVVLTAAHCVDHPKDEFKTPVVHVGRHFQNRQENGYEEFQTTRTVIHPQWDQFTNENDIALLLLERPSKEEPVLLADAGGSLKDGQLLTVLGWGRTSEGGAASDALQEVTVPKLDVAQCKSSYVNRITQAMFCAGKPEGGFDACQGDSGGPILMKAGRGRDEQVGVVSWGHGCARPGLPGVYASIAHLKPWIDKEVKILSALSPNTPSRPDPSRPVPPPPPPRPKPSKPPKRPHPRKPPSKRPPSPKPRPPAFRGDPCECSTDGRSGGVDTGRVGCDKHLEQFGDSEFFCMVRGGSECRSATASKGFPGAAWRACRAEKSSDEREPGNSIGNGSGRPAATVSFGPFSWSLSIGSGSGGNETSRDACECTGSGISGGIETPYRGCKQHSWFNGRYDYWCMVKGGDQCASATPSQSFKGAAWIPCERG